MFDIGQTLAVILRTVRAVLIDHPSPMVPFQKYFWVDRQRQRGDDINGLAGEPGPSGLLVL